MKYQRNSSIVSREFDDKSYLLSSDNTLLITLNETGSFIWRELDKPKTIAQIAKKISSVYDVSLESAQSDVEDMIESLKEKSLIEAVND